MTHFLHIKNNISKGKRKMRMNKTASSAWSIMALFAASMATSCSSDSFSEDGNSNGGEGKTVTLTAKVNDNDATTRVGMSKETDDAVSFYWHSSDAILVQTVSGSTYSDAKFTTETATGETSAEFTGTVESAETLGTYAVYPYSDKHSFTSATALTYNLPATYEYSTVESGIFSKTDGTNTTYRSTSTNIPMVGEITEDAIEFKHIGGLAVIRIDEMPAVSGTLTVTADQQLCGDFTISDLSADGAAMVTSTTTATDDNKTVTFSFSGAATGSAGVFCLPLATGSYSGMKITINYGETTQTVNYGNLYVARASVNAIPLYNHDGTVSKFSKIDGNVYTLNGQEFVDLGLPSGLLWATTNIGAEISADFGKYYAWGEVTAYGEAKDWGDYAIKTKYDFTAYKYGTSYSNQTKYNSTDGKKILEAEDDAATRNCGSGSRMPTYAEFNELVNASNCTWTWDESMTNSSNSAVTGHKVVSVNNGSSIFIPASGMYSSTSFTSNNGYYWSSQHYSSYFSYNLLQFGYDKSYQANANQRQFACSVRAVTEK